MLEWKLFWDGFWLDYKPIMSPWMKSCFSGPVDQMPISRFPAVRLLNSSMACLSTSISVPRSENLPLCLSLSKQRKLWGRQDEPSTQSMSLWAYYVLWVLPSFLAELFLLCIRTLTLTSNTMCIIFVPGQWYYILSSTSSSSLEASNMHQWAGTHTGTHTIIRGYKPFSALLHLTTFFEGNMTLKGKHSILDWD